MNILQAVHRLITELQKSEKEKKNNFHLNFNKEKFQHVYIQCIFNLPYGKTLIFFL